MSNPGSSFGWVFPAGQSKQQIMDEATEAFERCGYSAVQKTLPNSEYLEVFTKSGLPRSFWFRTETKARPPHGHVLYTSARSTQLRPFDLDLYPESLEQTQADYDLAKQVFDLMSATECFGFHNSQDNALVFKDSNLDFFFMKKGVQLVLVHLEERRALTPDEWNFVVSCDAEYEPFLRWDKLLHSTFFTRFSEDSMDQINREYNVTHRLIESDWNDYYNRTN